MKKLIVCADGTWDKATNKHPTNVERMHTAVASAADDGTPQLPYYHPGVGTSFWERLPGGAFGYGLSRNVRDCYRFLVEHYEAGDELYLFGFSRGAFTARSLAGFIRNAGILTPAHADRIDEGYALYRNKEGPDAASAVAFRERYAWSVRTPITFIGVWDTVGALGVPDVGLPWTNWLNRRYQFHDTQLSSTVRYAYQALAVDEARRPFVPTLWAPKPGVPDQTVEQVWFTGVHCDVGGGYPESELSDITWHWMAARACATGLALSVPPPPFDPTWAMGVLHDSRSGLYKAVRPYSRPIGTADAAHEFLASTAVARHSQDGWKPQNVTTYLAGAPQTMSIS
jgi:uncharacterized protein (DUF2235 family)